MDAMAQHDPRTMRDGLHGAGVEGERVLLALEATDDGLWDWDLATGAVYFSPRWLGMLGYGADELPPRVEAWRSLIHPEDQARREAALARHLAGEGERYASEHRCRDRSGDWIWVLERGRVVRRDRDGAPLRLVGAHTDISASKESAHRLEAANRDLLDRVQDRTAMLLQSEKMASVGQLAAGIAHEINNPAGFVNNNLDTLKGYVQGLMELCAAGSELLAEAEAGRLAPDAARARMAAIKERIHFDFIEEDIADLLDESLEGMERISRIVSDLKDFSHVDKEDAVAENDLNALVDKAVNVAWNELKYSCEVRKRYGAIPPVPVNGGQISQVVLNLLVNAAQAIEGHGVIEIATARDANQVLLTVRDDGVGIPAADRLKIFDPFYTTKPVGQGTGLGLHICQRIVKAHGGAITVESEVGQGTSFVVSLPLRSPTGQDDKGA